MAIAQIIQPESDGKGNKKFILFYTLAGQYCLFTSPVLWTFIGSIQPEINIISVPPKIDFSSTIFANYIELFFGILWKCKHKKFDNNNVIDSLATLISSLVGIFLENWTLLESYFGLALEHSTFILPVIVWILKGFFEVFHLK